MAKILNDKNETIQVAESPQSKIVEWHTRLGHVNEHILKEMLSKEIVHGLDFDSKESIGLCEVCIKGKQTQRSFPQREEVKTSSTLEIIHTDICGPMRVSSKGGAKYFITFIDDKSRWCEIFLEKKSEALNAFKHFKLLRIIQGIELNFYNQIMVQDFATENLKASLCSMGSDAG